MERNRKVVLPLTEAEWQALVAKARSEDRTPDLQARRILRRALRLSEIELRRAFVDGAAWWNFNSTGFTMFGSERREAEAEAEARFPNGKPGPVEVQP
jgi:hypothetical protein